MHEHDAPVRLSIIVPVYNTPRELRDCLAAAAAQSGPDTEIIVVDDASTDDTPAVAAERADRVFRLSTNSGPAAARNHGARQARGELLFFVDGDVVIAPGAVERVRRTFADRPDIAAMFGSYDVTPRAAGHVSRYRNLLHHFVHQNGHADAATFWAGCGAIRRDVFHAVGGFDARRFPRPSIEDIELGHRLREAGHKIVLDRNLQATHLKRWRLVPMIRTDITQRAIPWSRLILETRAMPDALNLAWSQRLSAALVAVAAAAAAVAGLKPPFALVAVAALAGVVVINRDLYRLFFRSGGLPLTVIGIALHILYFVYSSLSYFFVWLEHRFLGHALRAGRASTPSQYR
jgi:glycosyltransferase involved in cell wall biosynthesis